MLKLAFPAKSGLLPTSFGFFFLLSRIKSVFRKINLFLICWSIVAQGYKARKDGWLGGIAVATHFALTQFAGKKSRDCRGLARYAITNLIGADGSSMMTISRYILTRERKGKFN